MSPFGTSLSGLTPEEIADPALESAKVTGEENAFAKKPSRSSADFGIVLPNTPTEV